MSQALTLARPYARAAFSMARDAGNLPAWSNAFAFAAQVAGDPRVASLLGNPRLTQAEAVELLSPEASDDVFPRFLAVLAENRRLALLPEIAGLYDGLRNEAEGGQGPGLATPPPRANSKTSGACAALRPARSRDGRRSERRAGSRRRVVIEGRSGPLGACNRLAS